MRHRVHQVAHAGAFAVRYWGAIGLLLLLPVVGAAVSARGLDASPLAVLTIPWVFAITVVALLLWRWRKHQLHVTADAIVERRHPLLVYRRRRTFDEIHEVVLCPAERRGLEHGESSLLIRCDRPERDLVVAPANAEQFLDDLRTADPSFERYRGKVVRRRRQPEAVPPPSTSE